MIKKVLCNLLSAGILIMLIASSARATHLMGGSLNYTYLGQDSVTGNYQYQITLELFRLCDAGSTLLPIDMNIGVYIDDPNNPNGDKLLVLDDVLPLTIQKNVTPPNGNDSCTFAPNVCVEKGIYEAQFSFPGSPTSGFYFISDRCCRNNNILNLNNPGNAGQVYYATAPPPSNLINSSPTFAAAPVPFICAQDTASILNQAVDADGDSLVYSFVTPYNGIANPGDPNPTPPNPYPWPITNTVYDFNYSVTSPFGPGGYINMNSATGLASYYVPNQGFYVLAVEIQEYRNGVLIGVSRRDIQIIVIPCPLNPAPNLSSSTSQINYTIQEGDTLCFNTTFNDSNGDSVFVSHTGNIFGLTPPATFIDSSGAGSATGQFCWYTGCAQGNNQPYQFTVIANDNGCPAKTTNIVYTITVENTPKPVSLSGPLNLCADALNNVTYGVPADSGYTFSWSVTNGNIVGSSTGNTVVVNFNGAGTATLSAATVNHNGCLSDTISRQVTIGAIPVANAGSDVSFCSGANAALGTTSTSGYTYGWSPATGLSSATASNPTVTLVNTGTLPLTSSYIVTTTLNGCVNTDTVDVTVNPGAVADAGTSTALCSGNSLTIGSANTPGYIYLWSPATGLSSTTISNPSVTLTNTGTTPITQTYTLTVQNSFNCTATDSITITVNFIPASSAGNDVSFCSGGSANIGTTSTSGYTYSWNPAGGLSNASASDPSVTLTNTTVNPLTTSFIVTTSQSGCSSTDTVDVTVNPNPISDAGNTQALCAGGSVQLGAASTNGYTYVWTPATGLNNTTISNPVLTLNNSGPLPDTLFYVVTTTFNGCTTTDSVQIVSGPAPAAIAGSDVSYCSGSSAQIGTVSQTNYTYSWTPSSGLNNSTSSNPTVTLTNTTGSPVTTTFIVTADLFGCTGTDTVDVTVNPSPVSNAGTNQLLCAGNTVQLGGASTTGYTYSWTPSNGINNTTISNPVLTLNNTNPTPDTLLYIVTTDLNGCITSDTVQVISSPASVAIAGTDTVYCSGATTVIGSASQTNYTYSWSPAAGLNNATISDPTVTLTNTTSSPVTTPFIVTTNLFGCLDADTVDITIKPNPLADAGAAATLCGGDTLQLGTTSTVGYTYNWSPSTGLNSTTISNPVLVVNNTSGSATSTTYIVVTELNGCIITDSVTVDANPQPVVTATVAPLAICAGDSAVLTASGADTYGWAISTSPSTIINTNANFTVNPSATTTYILTGTNSSLCSNTNTVTLTVNPLPAVQISSSANTICNGDTLTLNATGAANYTWSIAGGAVIGTGSSIQVNPSSNTTYVVSGVSGALCSANDTINVVVNPAATITAVIGTTSVCPGVTGVQYWVLNPNATSTYNWIVSNGTIVSGQGTDTITVDWSVNSGTGLVTAVENTDLGCLSQAINLPVTINVVLNPIAPTGPSTLCANAAQGISYSALNTPGSTYNWFAQGGTIASGNGSSNVTVNWTVSGPQVVQLWYQETSVTAVDTCFGSSDTLLITINARPNTGNITGPSGICVVDTGSFSVVNNSTSSYNWIVNGGSILSGNGSSNVTVNWNGSGNASVAVVETNDLGCIGDTVFFPVTVNALPAANAGSDVSVCTGQGVQLTASGGVSYSWLPAATLSNAGVFNPVASPTSPTEYIVLVTDANGCKNTDSILVSVNALPVITLTSNSVICIGNSITLNAGGGTSYQWSPAGSLSDPTASNPEASPVATTTYSVVVTDQNSCVDSANVTVTVNALPTAAITADTLVCQGSSTTLTATGGVSYQWAPSTTLSSTAIANPVATPLEPTVYSVTVTDGNGCTNTTSISLSLNVQPTASFTVVDGDLTLVTCDGYKGSLTNTSTDAVNYLWSFPDGSISTDVNPGVQLNVSGNNTITLVAINNICSDTSVVNFESTVVDQVFAQMPNVFTPNNDGINDCFVFGKTINLDDCSSMEVFNRWGNKVFESSAGQPCWNGKKDGDGTELAAGTYFIVVNVQGKTYKGYITLIR